MRSAHVSTHVSPVLIHFILLLCRQAWEPFRDTLGTIFQLASPEAQQFIGLLATVLVILVLNKWTARQG